MKEVSSLCLIASLLAALLLPAAVRAQTPPTASIGAQAAPTYVPPIRGAPSRRVGGSSRGAEQTLPQIAVLAPDHVGLTTAEQPVLYWFISKPTQVRLEITLIDDVAIKPMLELPVMAVEGPGVYALDLAKHGIRLKPGIEYQWTVALVPDNNERSGDVISSGIIRRDASPPALQAALSKAGSDAERALAFAGAGIWYDAIDLLSRQIAANPGNPALRNQRAALAEQVGLADIAAFDRGAK